MSLFTLLIFVVMFAITGLLLIFVTAHVWKIFLNLKSVRQLVPRLQTPGEHALLKAIFLIPLLLIGTYLIIHYLLWPTQFFPILGSPVILGNTIGLIISYSALHVIRIKDKAEKFKSHKIVISLIAYLLILYLCNLIIIIATAVVWMNTAPQSMQVHPFSQGLILYLLFLLHFIFVYIAMLFNRNWKVILVLVYTFMISQAYYGIHAETVGKNNAFNSSTNL